MKIQLEQLETLAAILDEQSFERAAEKLCITQSAVSQRLRQLEAALGQTLLIRGNPITLTDAGHTALRYYQQAHLLQEEFLQRLNPSAESGREIIHLGVNADSLSTWLFDALQPLLDEDRILLRVKVDDQNRTRELMKTGEVAACISADAIAIQGCHCLSLGVMRYRCLVAPAFKKRYFAAGVNLEALQAAPAVQFNHKDELVRQYLETHYDSGEIGSKHRIPSTESYVDLIARGYAWGIVPDMQSKTLRKNGKLVELVRNKVIDVPLYWHIWNLKTRLNQRLTRLIQDQAASVLRT